MKTTYITLFEQEQRQYGTKIALSNVLIALGYEIMQQADPTITGFSLRRARKTKAPRKAAVKKTR